MDTLWIKEWEQGPYLLMRGAAKSRDNGCGWEEVKNWDLECYQLARGYRVPLVGRQRLGAFVLKL